MVPDELDEALTTSWLTAALGERFPGLEVTEVEPGPVVARVSTNARFRITCRDGLPEGLSEHLCIKGYFGDDAAPFRPIGEPEVRFYRDLAISSGIRTLRPVWAKVDPVSRHGVVITEDVAVQGARFLNPADPYSVDQLAASLGELATLHAHTWDERPGKADEWGVSPMALIAAGRPRGVIEANFDGPIGAEVPAASRDAVRLHRLYPLLAAAVGEVRPRPVIHGDAHVGNVFVGLDGHPGFVDWQLVHRGPWYLDVGYHIAACISVEERRANEDDLLLHYLERLAVGGVEAPDLDTARREVVLGTVHGFYLWSITQKVHAEMTTALVGRLGTAVDDHDGLAAVEAWVA